MLVEDLDEDCGGPAATVNINPKQPENVARYRAEIVELLQPAFVTSDYGSSGYDGWADLPCNAAHASHFVPFDNGVVGNGAAHMMHGLKAKLGTLHPHEICFDLTRVSLSLLSTLPLVSLCAPQKITLERRPLAYDQA